MKLQIRAWSLLGTISFSALLLSACGGGGGGETTGSAPPPVTPPVADISPPRLMALSPTNGATGVAPNTSVEAIYDEPLKCDGVSGQTLQVAGVNAIVSCDGANKRVSLAFLAALPIDTVVTATLPPATDLAGNQAQPVVVTFRTVTPVVTTPKAYVGIIPQVDGSRAVAIIDTAANTFKHVDFPGVPGFQPLYANVVDALTGKVYFAGRAGFQLYVIDLVSDVALAPIRLDPAFTVNHLIWDLVLLETELCALMSDSLPAGTSRNRLHCRDRFDTSRVTYNGANNSLAADDHFVTRLKYVTAPTKKLYALAALRTAVYFPPPGTPSTLVAMDPATKAVTDTYRVGSGANEFDIDPRNGDVWVANPGDPTISIVRPSTGHVETWDLEPRWFAGFQQLLIGLALDPGKDRLYLTNSQVVLVYELSTRRRIDVVNVGVDCIPGRLMLRGGELWVACSGGYIAVLSRDTLTELRRFAVGNYPNAFTIYQP